MNTLRHLLLCITLAATIAIAPTISDAQVLAGPPADPQYKYSTPMPPGVAAPDTLETRFGR